VTFREPTGSIGHACSAHEQSNAVVSLERRREKLWRMSVMREVRSEGNDLSCGKAGEER